MVAGVVFGTIYDDLFPFLIYFHGRAINARLGKIALGEPAQGLVLSNTTRADRIKYPTRTA